MAMRRNSPAHYDYKDFGKYTEYTYSMVPSSSHMHTRNSKFSNIATRNHKKEQLARAMKAKYLTFRKSLEKTNNVRNNQANPLLDYALRTPIHFTNKLEFNKFPTNSSVDSEISNYSTPHSKDGNSRPIARSRDFTSKVPISLRSAEEAKSTARLSGIHLLPIHIPRTIVNKKRPMALGTNFTVQRTLRSRLRTLSKQRGFDPSIIVDLFRHLKVTSANQARRKPTAHRSISFEKTENENLSTNILVRPKTKNRLKVTKRLVGTNINQQNYLTREAQISEEKQNNEAGFYTHSNGNNLNAKEMSMFIQSELDVDEKGKDAKLHAKEGRTYPEKNIKNDNQPKIDALNNPEISLQLPEGVRDSLRKYLKPLVQTLKPLKKSVPGLPGLDYPILSVVPYTNFYCSNMPWPGYYADTEARCQSWHACDVDGRQSTFLCPNGTVFNQALMVCDWWFNTDCLVSPFLYPINERLFGTLAENEPIVPHQRITPELLDTIFT